MAPNVALRSGVFPMKLLTRDGTSTLSRMWLCMCITARCVNLFWLIVLRIQVFSRPREENDLSDGAADTGRHRQSSINASTSLNCPLVCGCSAETNSATSGTDFKIVSLVMSLSKVSCICKLDLLNVLGRWTSSSPARFWFKALMRFGPSKPRSLLRGKQQHPATLTDKRKENETKRSINESGFSLGSHLHSSLVKSSTKLCFNYVHGFDELTPPLRFSGVRHQRLQAVWCCGCKPGFCLSWREGASQDYCGLHKSLLCQRAA